MSPAPHAPRAARRHAWPRVLVLLLALLLPGAHTEAHGAPATAVAGEGGGTAVEYDVLDSVLRPTGRGGRRPVVPQRPAPLPDTGPAYAAPRPAPAPPGPPYALRTLRSVVLRC